MKLQDEEIYHRDALARTYVDLLQTSYASSGVFLAAPAARERRPSSRKT